MEPVSSIRRLGFRKWHERQLIDSHLSLTTCFLCVIVIAARAEGLSFREFGARSASLLAVVIAAILLGCVFALDAGAQEFFRCTAPDGKVTYQEAPCPKASEERKVDATPANPDFDPSQRDRLLKQGEEAGKRLEARAAKEEEERKRRADERARDEQRERETRAREEAREGTSYIYAWPPGTRPPYGGYPPKPQPKPVKSTTTTK